MTRSATAAVAALMLATLAAAPATSAPDGPLASSAAHHKHKKKRFKGYFTFRMAGDGCVPSTSHPERPRFVLFGAVPADPRHPLAPHGLSTIGEDIAVCLPGFNGFKPMTVRVSLPDGRTEERALEPDSEVPGLHGFTWFVEPGSPLGRYVLTARQGSAVAHAWLVVRRARSPLLRAARPSAQLGRSLHVVFAGFRPHERVRVGVYRARVRRCAGQRSRARGSISFCFTRNVFATTVDGRGELSSDVPIGPAQYRSGEYWLLALAPSAARVVYGPRFDVCPASTPAAVCGLDGELLP